MLPLTLQEVIDKIKKSNSIKVQQTSMENLDNRNDRQAHRPEFYLPRITRRMAIFMFGHQSSS